MTCQKCGLPEKLCICKTKELREQIRFGKESCYKCGRNGEYVEGKFGKTWLVNIIGGLCDFCRHEETELFKKHLKEMYRY